MAWYDVKYDTIADYWDKTQLTIIKKVHDIKK